MATPLANFFTRIGFEVDKSSIRDVEKNLERLESRIKSMANSFQSITNAPAVRAATRLANAEARRITAEMSLNKQNMSVEKLKQQNILEGTRLERNKQMTAKVVEQSRLQELRNKAHEFRQQHSASRVRVNNHGGMSFGIPMDSVKGAVGAVAGIETARRFAQQSFRVGNFQIAQPAQFEFVTGSAEEAQKEIAFLNSEVDRLSLNMMDANKQYLKLFAAGGKKIGSEKTRELFSGFQNLATMLGLSGDAQNRGLNSFTQMISKGQVYSEELKGQLAEALPGATEIFADALFGDGTRGSGDTKKLFKAMEDGKVGIEELIKVIEYMRKLTDDKKIKEYVEKSPEKAFQRMSNAWMRFIMEVNNAGLLDAMTAALDGAADAIKILTKVFKPFISLIKLMGEGIWKYAIKPLLDFISLLKEIPYIGALASGAILGMVAAFTKATPAVGAFMGTLKAVSLFLRRFLVYPVLIYAGVTLMVLALEALQGQENYFTKATEQKDKGFLGWLAAAGRMALETLGFLTKMGVALAMFGVDMFKGKNAKDWNESLNTLIGFTKESYGKFAEADARTGFSAGVQKAFGYYPENMVNSGNLNPTLSALSSPITKVDAARYTPWSIAKPSQPVDQKVNITNNVTLNGINDPRLIADMVTSELDNKMTNMFIQTQSNYVMRNGAK